MEAELQESERLQGGDASLRELEERVRARTEELQQRVRETEDLNRGMTHLLEDLQEARIAAEKTARDLERANRELDAANKELEAFSYSVSHDLRGPLRNVSGFIDLLLRAEPGDNQQIRHFLQVIAAEVGRMSDLIGGLLSFSRVGRSELHHEQVDMEQLAERAWRGLEGERKGREIDWVRDPLPSVRGDPTLLALVWTNLLGNAVKYTGPRSPARVCAGALPGTVEDGLRVFFVRDNGVGFDMRYADKLFGVFQRLHTARDFEGTGIGLANVQRIVQRHGGRVWPEAVVNQGATFFFSLPPA